MRIRSNSEMCNYPITCGYLYTWNPATKRWVNPIAQNYGSTYWNPAYKAKETCIDELHAGPPYRTGGPFDLGRFKDTGLEPTSSGTYYGGSLYKYEGGFLCGIRPTNVYFTVDYDGDHTSWSDMDASPYGATGWNRFRPGNPTADAAVFIGELTDLARMLRGTAKAFADSWRLMGGNARGFAPKSVADHWLNTQFGWLPFISDLRKFYTTYVDMDRLLKHIIRNNGRWTRRGGTVVDDQDETKLGSSEMYTKHFPSLPAQFHKVIGSSGSYELKRVKRKHVWFEGAFRYWIPDIGSVQWKRRAIAHLYGLYPCPSLVWELTPFSWLVDWFSNVGDVIENFTNGWAENLASKYAYVMAHNTVDLECHSTLSLKTGALSHTWSYPLERKHRVGASPFGFGLDSGSFSPRQWSILGALGLSRLR